MNLSEHSKALAIFPRTIEVFDMAGVEDAADSPAKDAANQLAGQFNNIAELRLSAHKGMTLVRPDGYIAYSARTSDSLTALHSVRMILERQTRQASTATPPSERAA